VDAMKRLIFLGCIPFGLLYFNSENLFILIFGSEWREAGVIASILAPMFYLQFIASPLSYTLFLAGKNIYDLLWQIMSAVIISVILLINDSATSVIQSMSIAYSCLYLMNIHMSFKAASGND
jgi:O-antigen/teichoic acid export membrane protein